MVRVPQDELGRDALIEVVSAAVVLLHREDDGAHDERQERPPVVLAAREHFAAMFLGFFVELAPRLAEEKIERGQEDEERGDRKERLRRVEKRFEHRGLGDRRRRDAQRKRWRDEQREERDHVADFSATAAAC